MEALGRCMSVFIRNACTEEILPRIARMTRMKNVVAPAFAMSLLTIRVIRVIRVIRG